MTDANIVDRQLGSMPQTVGEIRTNGNPGSASPVERPVNTDSKPITTSK